MILIIGLGNPGTKFKNTRHNLGFEILNEFKEENQFSDWKLKSKLKSQLSEGRSGRKKILLAKPQTFMNNSGRAVLLLSSFYKTKTEDIWILHDDLDIDLGKMKIITGHGPAGHNGVKSIIRELGTNNFIRFRIGIKPEDNYKPRDLKKFVLQKFTKKEKEEIKKAKHTACAAIDTATRKGIEKAMNDFN